MIALLPRLRRFAITLTGDIADADDLTQSTCERAIANLDKWELGTRLDSWMYRIAQNLFRNQRRDGQLREDHMRDLACRSAEDASRYGAADGEAAVVARLQLHALESGIADLPVDQRTVLLLVAVEGRGYKETAEILDLPIGTVTSRLARARDVLRQKLDGEAS